MKDLCPLTLRRSQTAAKSTDSPIAGAFSIGQQNTRVQHQKNQGEGWGERVI